jgi:hypothetical protein
MNIYIHVENVVRELDSKILLAILAASRGHQVIVSNLSSITRGVALRLLAPGIFHTKSLTPGEDKILRHQKLIDSGRSKDINLHYSINMTDIPDDFIKIWKQFKQVRLHLSIDDLEERNDYIRYGAKWELIHKNFLKIIKYRNIFKLEVCQTVSCLNVFNIDKFKEFTNKYNLVVAHNYVHHPSFQHVSILPDELKEELLNNINHLNEFELERLKAELYSNQMENGMEKFINFIKDDIL